METCSGCCVVAGSLELESLIVQGADGKTTNAFPNCYLVEEAGLAKIWIRLSSTTMLRVLRLSVVPCNAASKHMLMQRSFLIVGVLSFVTGKR